MVSPHGNDRPPVAWVTGAGGLVGHSLVEGAPRWAPGWQVVGLTRERLDLTNRAGVERLWRETEPRVVFHCAAVSKAVACQADPAYARAINVGVTAHLADLAARIPFIFISTDHVFDGRRGSYRETDPVSPLTVYGTTKVEAERIVLANPLHTVVRTSLNAGISPTGDRSFLEETTLAWRRGQPVRLFTDEFRSPIPVVVTARALWELAVGFAPGLYHLAGAERLSRWEIGELLAAQYSELRPQCLAGSLRDYAGPPRSPDLSMDCTKLQARLSFQLPGFREWVAAHPRRGSDEVWCRQEE